MKQALKKQPKRRRATMRAETEWDRAQAQLKRAERDHLLASLGVDLYPTTAPNAEPRSYDLARVRPQFSRKWAPIPGSAATYAEAYRRVREAAERYMAAGTDTETERRERRTREEDFRLAWIALERVREEVRNDRRLGLRGPSTVETARLLAQIFGEPWHEPPWGSRPSADARRTTRDEWKAARRRERVSTRQALGRSIQFKSEA